MKVGVVFMVYDIVSPRDSYRSALPEFHTKPRPIANWSFRYVAVKKITDVGFSLVALPTIAVAGVILLALNPLLNPGPLLFRQERMGLGGKKIRLWKFRTMTGACDDLRGHDEPLEEHRITRLGKILRRTRIDELPNFFNVLSGDMSLIGPRPDAWEHAIVHIVDIPHYVDRFRVLPGITGLAQVRGGYADNARATERKARFDRFYIKRSRIKLDAYIIAKTIQVLVTGFGAK